MLEYKVHARRVGANGSIATCKRAELVIDTAFAGRADAFNSAELFLKSIAAYTLKGIERVTPLLKFDLRGIEVSLDTKRQNSPPRTISVDHILTIDSDQSDQRLELLNTKVRKYGTIFNNVAEAAGFSGRLIRKT